MRCLCCGMPSEHSLCNDCSEALLVVSDVYPLRAWTSIAVEIALAEMAQHEHIYRP